MRRSDNCSGHLVRSFEARLAEEKRILPLTTERGPWQLFRRLFELLCLHWILLSADREPWAIFNQAGWLFGWWPDSKQRGESSRIVILFYLTFLFVMHTDRIISFSDGEKSGNSKVLYKYISAWAFSNGLTLTFGKSTNIHIQSIFFWIMLTKIYIKNVEIRGVQRLTTVLASKSTTSQN